MMKEISASLNACHVINHDLLHHGHLEGTEVGFSIRVPHRSRPVMHLSAGQENGVGKSLSTGVTPGTTASQHPIYRTTLQLKLKLRLSYNRSPVQRVPPKCRDLSSCHPISGLMPSVTGQRVRLFCWRLRLHSKERKPRFRLLCYGEPSSARVIDFETAREKARKDAVPNNIESTFFGYSGGGTRRNSRDGRPDLSATNRTKQHNSLARRPKQLAIGRSRIHRIGLFALEEIQRGEFITEYLGEVLRTSVADLREKKYLKQGISSTYMYELSLETILDGTRRGCIARYCNHSCDPNVRPKLVVNEGKRAIELYGRKKIQKGEELTFNYNFEYEGDEDKIPCLCGASKCRKFLN